MKSPSALKQQLFDSLFFAYTAALLLFLFLEASHQMGWIQFAPTQEYAISRMSSVAAAFLGLCFCGALATLLLKKLQIQTLGHTLFVNSTSLNPRTYWITHLLLAIGLTLIVSLQMTDFSVRELTDPDGLKGAFRLFNGLAHANLAILPTAIVQVIETIFIAFLATAIAVPVAFLLSFLCAKNTMSHHPAAFSIYVALRTLLNVVRSVEPLIWALIFTVWVGVGPFAGMLALMLHTVASLAKQFSEIVEDVAQGPIDGVRSTGANSIQVIWFGIVPQVLLPFIAFTIYRWDTNVRMATVIGLVGGGGIGTLLIKYQGQAMWPEVGCIILVIAVAVWLMDIASAYIREALR